MGSKLSSRLGICSLCCLLTIPKEFARANGLENRCCKIVLLNEQGKVWMGHLGFKQRDGQPYIKHRWTAFLWANSLKAGDPCVFELIQDGEKPVLKITNSECFAELYIDRCQRHQ